MATLFLKSPSNSQPRSPSEANRRHIARIVVDRLRASNPHAHCELYFETPYQLLVSVVLSAQTTDKMVNRCMEPLHRAGFDVSQALAWGEAGLLERIRAIGLAPTKARNVVRLSKMLLEQHGGNVPRSREDLEALPGVGRKTANVILGEIYGEPTLAVDTHVFRVGARLGLHDEKTPEKAEGMLLKVISPDDLPLAHHLLIWHGRYVCKAQKPDCEHCVLADICPSAVFEQPRPPRSQQSIQT